MNVVGFGAMIASLVLGGSVLQSAETIATVLQRFAAPLPSPRALIGSPRTGALRCGAPLRSICRSPPR